MKKIYNKPTTYVVKLTLENMIAASTEMYGKDADSAAMGRDRGSRNGDDNFEDLW